MAGNRHLHRKFLTTDTQSRGARVATVGAGSDRGSLKSLASDTTAGSYFNVSSRVAHTTIFMHHANLAGDRSDGTDAMSPMRDGRTATLGTHTYQEDVFATREGGPRRRFHQPSRTGPASAEGSPPRPVLRTSARLPSRQQREARKRMRRHLRAIARGSAVQESVG